MSKNHNVSETVNQLVNDYIIDEEWDKAQEILEDELEKNPENHWLITQLSEVFYEKQDYETALKLSTQAIRLAPDCPLVINDHALHLYMHERDDEAIELWSKLLEKGVRGVAYGECGEGVKFAKSLLNDVRARMALSYLAINNKKQALQYFNQHLENRQRGLFSNFTKREIIKKINEIV